MENRPHYLSRIKPQQRPLRAAVNSARNWVESHGQKWFKDKTTGKIFKAPGTCECAGDWGRLVLVDDTRGFRDVTRTMALPNIMDGIFTKKEASEYG